MNSDTVEHGSIYMKDQYDVKAIFNNHHYDPNMLSRIRNTVVTALNENSTTPKILVFCLENDLMRFIAHENFGLTIETGMLLQWLITEVNRVILSRLDQLPKKAKRPGQPHVIWMALPLHSEFADNESRRKFNKCLEAIIPLYENMSVLAPKKGWDAVDKLICSKNKISAVGMKIYWKAIDAAVQFWDQRKNKQVIQRAAYFESKSGNKLKALSANDGMHQGANNKRKTTDEGAGAVNKSAISPAYKRKFFYNKNFRRQDRFHWSNKSKQGGIQSRIGRKLPTPPAKRSAVNEQ